MEGVFLGADGDEGGGDGAKGVAILYDADETTGVPVSKDSGELEASLRASEITIAPKSKAKPSNCPTETIVSLKF
ncbi:MAG: hypothetical protein ACK5LK_03175 [Chthoniobacterales bacterium]